ncbi:unnamed protein product [Dicrocoelium dendriticum]|nr:unnamed protein product [Dicrocoelium dendriticum]
MRVRCNTTEDLGVSWRFASQWASAMGKHLRRLMPCGDLPTAIMGLKNRLYSRWTGLLLSDPVIEPPLISEDTMFAVVDSFCYEANRLLTLWLPERYHNPAMLRGIYSSVHKYLLQPTADRLLVSVAYLLLGPSGSLFLDDLRLTTGQRSHLYSQLKRTTHSRSSSRKIRRRKGATSISARAFHKKVELDTLCSSISSCTYRDHSPHDFRSWARNGRLNPMLAMQPRQTTCLTQYPVAKLVERAQTILLPYTTVPEKMDIDVSHEISKLLVLPSEPRWNGKEPVRWPDAIQTFCWILE